MLILVAQTWPRVTQNAWLAVSNTAQRVFTLAGMRHRGNRHSLGAMNHCDGTCTRMALGGFPRLRLNETGTRLLIIQFAMQDNPVYHPMQLLLVMRPLKSTAKTR